VKKCFERLGVVFVGWGVVFFRPPPKGGGPPSLSSPPFLGIFFGECLVFCMVMLFFCGWGGKLGLGRKGCVGV